MQPALGNHFIQCELCAACATLSSCSQCNTLCHVTADLLLPSTAALTPRMPPRTSVRPLCWARLASVAPALLVVVVSKCAPPPGGLRAAGCRLRDDMSPASCCSATSVGDLPTLRASCTLNDGRHKQAGQCILEQWQCTEVLMGCSFAAATPARIYLAALLALRSCPSKVTKVRLQEQGRRRSPTMSALFSGKGSISAVDEDKAPK